MSKAEPHILLTGAGGSIAVNVTRSLKMAPSQLALYGCDSSRYFIHLAETEEKALVPPSSEEDEYLQAIRKLTARWKIDLILPSNMNEILLLARHREHLGAKLFLPSLEAIEVGADKWKTYEELLHKKLPVPHTLLVREPSDIDHAFSEFGSPVWFRGRGIPGRGIGVASLPARTPEQARGWVDFHEAWDNMTAAEFMAGDNLTWMGLFRNGELIASQGRKRISYVISHVSPSGVTGAPSISHTVHDERIDDAGFRAMLTLDSRYNGVGFVDFKCDGMERPRITEVNAGRFGTTHHFYTMAGANFPYWYVQIAMGEMPRDAKPHHVLPADLYWVRTLDAGPVLLRKEELERYSP